MIRIAEISDSKAIARIYNHYITNSAITFETDEISAETISDRIDVAYAGGYPFWVCEVRDAIVGYCSLGRWNAKKAYDTSAELSIYIDPQYRGRGFGADLMRHLLTNIDCSRFHSLIGCVTMPNEASVALHEKFGFQRVSLFRQVGRKFDCWHDVAHWQLILPQNDKIAEFSTEESCPCGANYFCRCQ